MERANWILQTYKAVAQLSVQMLEAARNGQWDDLVTLEQKRDSVLTELRADATEAAIPDVVADQVSELIKAILAADSETGSLALSWRGELHELLDSMGTERKLFQAYGP